VRCRFIYDFFLISFKINFYRDDLPMDKSMKTEQESTPNTDEKVCGLIMPISGNDAYSAKHWQDVRAILEKAISKAGFKPNMVSNSDQTTIIHTTIVTNLYTNPIAVCDVSSKNPNVMFELGLRLAFDRPTIVVKDDVTTYNFDTAPIEHVGYPKDLRYQDIVEFSDMLTTKIQKTVEASEKDKGYSTFLKHFQNITPKKIKSTEVDQSEFIIKRIEQLTATVATISTRLPSLPSPISITEPKRRRDSEAIFQYIKRMKEKGMADSNIMLYLAERYDLNMDSIRKYLLTFEEESKRFESIFGDQKKEPPDGTNNH
jgi:hypothetical protein